MRYFVLFLFLFPSFFSFAQFEATNLFPVKINKKWGLIDMDGTLVMEPKYDLLGDRIGNTRTSGGLISVPYVIVQLNNQLGLINARGQEVLPPLYDDIVNAFADSVFTVKKDGNLLVVNQKGETIFDGKYEEVIPIPRDREHFIVKEKGKYGLVKKGEGYVIPNEYALLEVNKIRQPFLNFQTEASLELEQKGLISFKNKIIFPAEYEFITIVTSNHFLVKKDFYEIRDEDQNVLVPASKEWTTARPLSKSFIAFTSSYTKSSKIFSFKTNDYISTKTEFDGFEKFSNNFLLGKKDGRVGLIDTLGKEVIPPNYSAIEELDGDTLFKVLKFKQGIYNINQGLIAPTEYDDITSYNNTFAQATKKGKKGLLNRKGELVAPTQFETFQFQDEFVKAFQGQKMNYYEMDSLENLTLIDIYPEVYTLRIGYEDPSAIPNINPFSNSRMRFGRRNSGRGVKKRPDYSQIDKSNVEWFNDWGLWGLRKRSDGTILIKPQYEHTRKLPFTDLTVVYSYDDKIEENEFLKLLTIRPKKGGFGIAFYSHQQEKFVTGFEFMGVRVEDFEYDLPHAACLDKNGKFVLINKKGIVANNKKQFDYIGEFYFGKARICINSFPSKLKKPDEKGIQISSNSDFQQEFNIRFNRFLTAPTADLWWIGGTWGFIDSLGRVIISPQYESVRDFNNGTAICKKENWGAINDLNQPILDFTYKSITQSGEFLQVGVKNRRPIYYNALGNAVVGWGYDKFKTFSEGFCAVQKNGKWGMVNEKGKEVLECKYLTINSFSEGWASIQDEKGWYFVDSSMSVQLDFREEDYFGLGNFSDSLCWFKIKRHEKNLYGFMDKNGEVIINSIYSKAFDFQQGRARVVKNKKTGLINKKGKFVMKPKLYDLVFPFDENGIAQVRENNMGDYGLINSNGKTLTNCIYKKIFPFVDGYAKVVTPKGIGFVDMQGNEIIPAEYRAVGELSEGLVAVQRGFSYLWEYIDMNNNLAFKGKFSKAEPFKNGKAIVMLNRAEAGANIVIDTNGQEIQLEKNGMILHFSEEKYGFKKVITNAGGVITDTYCYYTDTLGNRLFGQKRFKKVEPYQKNIGLVCYDNNKWGTITHHGFSIIPNKFNKIFKLPNNMFSAISAELYGLYDNKGNQVLPPVFDYIKMKNRGTYQVEQGSQIGYFTTSKTWLWQMQN